ncbi:MAG TPA: DMT family transporter [Roseiflexaceae bacterium]|nr:DMT family transporter [Roseiflexaceae bacterium]
MPDNRNVTHALVLLGGVLLVASASVMIRQAQRLGMPSPSIAAWRLGLAALIVTPLALARVWPEIRGLRRRDVLLGVGSGAFLAMHFTAWITSLEYTSVASSSALVATNPLWIALVSVLLFRQRLTALSWLGVLITVAGSVLIAISDGGGTGGSNALLGDALALLGALAGSGYFLVGSRLQRRLSTLAYIWLVYTSAALILVLIAIADGARRGGPAGPGYPVVAYLLLLGLAIGPQLLGHTAFNWSLRHLSATFVAVATLGEPIGAALLALALFGQVFAPIQLLGFVVLLVGIAVAARGERRASEVSVSAAELPARG